MLGGKTILVDFMVIEDPLDFNMLLGSDYVYAMQVVVSTFFCVMYFNHNRDIVTIDDLDFLDLSPDPTRDEVFPLLIPSVSVDTTPPRVSYVSSFPSSSSCTENKSMCSCLCFWEVQSQQLTRSSFLYRLWISLSTLLIHLKVQICFLSLMIYFLLMKSSQSI